MNKKLQIAFAIIPLALLMFIESFPLTQANPETTTSVDIMISEIYYDTPNDLEEEFVELYVWDDAGLSDINMSGWYITTYDGDTEVLPAISCLEQHDYIAIYMGSGTNDLDASDGNATIYLNRATEMLNDTGDEVGLYNSTGVLQDFVRYGGGNGDPVLGNWANTDLGITQDNQNESIQIHGGDLNDSTNWVSAQPSPAEPNIFEWLMDPGTGLWYQIHNGLNFPMNLSVESGQPRLEIHNESRPLSASEIGNITEFLNYTYNYMNSSGLGTPQTASDGKVHVHVTNGGTFSGRAGGRGYTVPEGHIRVDLGDMANLTRRIKNKQTLEHEHIHLIQYKNAGGYGPLANWSDLEGMAEYWSVKITMKEFNITYENYTDIFKQFAAPTNYPTDWLKNTDRNFFEGFQQDWDYYWANHMFLRWINATFGQAKVEHIFKVRNVSAGITGMPAAVNKAFKEQNKTITFADLFRNWTEWIYDNFKGELGYTWEPTFDGTPLSRTETLNPWGTDYERIKINTTRNLNITFKGDGNKTYAITVLKKKDTTYDKDIIWVNGSTTFTIVNRNYTQIVLIKSQINSNRTTTYTINITSMVELRIIPHEGGKTDPAPGSYLRPPTTMFTVTARPDPGWVFDRWELDSAIVSRNVSYTVRMDDNHVLEAFFKKVEKPVGGIIKPISNIDVPDDKFRSLMPWIAPILIISTIFAAASIATFYKRKRKAKEAY